MLNPYIIKKYAALILAGIFTTVCFAIGSIFYNIWVGLVCYLAGMLVSILIGVLLLKNPFSAMLEGKGILTLNLSSTGIIQPFIVKVNPPFIRGKLSGRFVNDVFNRSTVMQIEPPTIAATPAQFTAEGGINITLTKDEMINARFGFNQYPVLIWNNQIESILTKDFLSDKEKEAFAEHGILYLNRKTEELTSQIRDFGRYIVETLKPKPNWYENKIIWIVIVIVLIILAALFAPALINAIKPIFQGTTTAASAAAKATSAITPR